MNKKQFDMVLNKAEELVGMGYSSNLIEHLLVESGINVTPLMVQDFMKRHKVYFFTKGVN